MTRLGRDAGMRGLRIAALLIIVYAFALAVNAGIYVSWSGDRGELPRLAVRLVGSLLLAYGLWTSARWAWWGAVFFTGVLSAIALPGLYLGLATGFLARRPYPAVDLAFFAVSIAALTSAFVVLVLPASRGAMGIGRRRWEW